MDRHDDERLSVCLKVARDGSSRRDEDLGEATCHLPSRPRAVRQAYRYGGSAHSRQEYHLPQPLANRSVVCPSGTRLGALLISDWFTVV